MAMKTIAAIAASLGVAFAASAANAEIFAGNWSLTVGDNSDPGHLKIFTDTQSGIFSKDLGAPNPEFAYENLFRIWTTESSIEADDLNGTTLSLTFNFDLPDDNSGPIQMGGTSSGYASWLGVFQGGQLIWNNGGVAELQWGNNLPNVIDPGRMTITLNGGVFNDGLFGTDRNCNWLGRNCDAAGEALGVAAEFHWDNNPTFGAPAPEPTTWALMIGGFGMTGLALRRRRGAVFA